ncbi:hypothetical protein BT69DRAFT_151266 [Atractiella rhizophila]|nr:hypothetical protein BT69DRAFT_151266 [Atractiella rhizophila]
MPWINLHPLYSSRVTKSKRWVAPKRQVEIAPDIWHDPNDHPHYHETDARLYPWTSSTFPRPRNSQIDRDLKNQVHTKHQAQNHADPAVGNEYGFMEGVEPVYGPERPRSNLHPRRIIQKNIRAFPGLGRWG